MHCLDRFETVGPMLVTINSVVAGLQSVCHQWPNVGYRLSDIAVAFQSFATIGPTLVIISVVAVGFLSVCHR